MRRKARSGELPRSGLAAALELWQDAVVESPTYARASGAILRFTEPSETRTRRRKKSWREAAAERRMALDARGSDA